MCGITALYLKSKTTILDDLIKSLNRIQHRGYDGAGFALDMMNDIMIKKGNGLINDVVNRLKINNIETNMGLGHVRYKTFGEVEDNVCQPILSKNNKLCLVHNGQIEAEGYDLDSNKILKEFEKVWNGDINKVLEHIFKTIHGSYSCVMMIHNVGLLAFRDPRGIKPLVYSSNGNDVIIASETVAILDKLNNKIYDVPIGGAIFVNMDGRINTVQIVSNTKLTPCIFEYIYIADKNSVLNGINVGETRKKMGQILAKKLDIEFDYIVAVPETSCYACIEISNILKKPYIEAIKLNPRQYERTFILPTQEQRENAVKNKFSINELYGDLLYDKTILLVDDSIIRGTTLKYIIQLLHNIDVKKIIVASLAPAVRYKNIYGIDIPNTDRLIAFNRTDDAIAKELGADQVIYQDQALLVKEMLSMNTNIINFECSIFDGLY
jgi:amidophosphoribosyltransferase